MAVSSVSSGSSSTGAMSFGGLATGLPADMVDQLMKAQQGQLNSYQASKARLADQKAIYTSLQSKLSDLTSKIVALQDASSWAPHTTSSSNTDKVTATGTNAAMAGTHTLHVAQLATSDTWVLGAYANVGDTKFSAASGVSSSTDTLTTGSNITFSYNGITYGTGAGTTGFADLNGQSLADVAAMINNIDYKDADGKSQPGISASVMYDGAAYRLVLTAKDSGQYTRSAGAMPEPRITMDAATNMIFSSAGSLTGFQNTVPAQDAVFRLNGVDVTSTSNAPSNILTGVTLQLKATTGAANNNGVVDIAPNGVASTPVVITVANDTATVKTTLQSFVDAYNAILDFVSANSNALGNSSLARTVVSQLRTALNGRTGKAGATGPNDVLTRSTLAEYGLRTDAKTGKISFSGTSLDTALQTDYSGLAALFTNTQFAVGTGNAPGLAYRLQTLLNGVTNGVTGSLTTQSRGLQTRMSRLDKDIAQETGRLDKVRQQLTLKFSNLEQMVSQLNSAGSAMTSALSKL
ncbi:MAG: flagellar filament capping protein FliD [Magnetococcus sp. DMHC-8]